jgi:hypothetical protein
MSLNIFRNFSENFLKACVARYQNKNKLKTKRKAYRYVFPNTTLA